MIFDTQKRQNPDPRAKGLPEFYPVPPITENHLFYIQRNHNFNTIVYELNRHSDGRIKADVPMHPFWIQYTDGGEYSELNYYQNKMAYGYTSKQVNPYCFEFNFVSYEALKLFISKDNEEKYSVFCNIQNEMSILNNIYVYAEEFGVFPNVKFIELYGQHIESKLGVYQRINIDL